MTFEKLDKVNVAVTISQAITDTEHKSAICKVNAGDTLVAKHPEKFYLSFQATGRS